MNNYKELKIWQKSVDLAGKVYEVTKSFPKEELYGLTYQLRKSAVSVPSNIGEGAGRNTKKDFNNFLGISNGSSYELDTQLIIAQRVDFIDNLVSKSLQEYIVEIQKMNWALKKTLE